jgi:hypothetical protein
VSHPLALRYKLKSITEGRVIPAWCRLPSVRQNKGEVLSNVVVRPAPAQSTAISGVVCAGRIVIIPVHGEGLYFLFHTPDADRSAQVPGVQSAGSPCSSELRKAVPGCGCAGLATSLARSMNRKFFFSCAEDARQQFALGLAAEGRVDASRRERLGCIASAGSPLAPAAQGWAVTEDLLQLADISCKAVHGPRREIEAARSMEASQSSTSAGFRVVRSPIPTLREPVSAQPELGCAVATAVSEE